MNEVTSVAAAQQGALLTKIAVAIAKNQLDAASDQGQAMLEMLEAAATAGRAADRGQQIDLTG
jgi:hypothetical protein